MTATTRDVQNCTAKILWRLLNSNSPAEQKAALANLRRGVGHLPGEVPQLWGVFLSDMPEKMYGRDGQPSREEWAIYTALTLFALHQQGHDPAREPMHREGEPLGRAVARLATNEEEMKRILHRLNAAATANSIVGLSHYLRGLIQLLRSQRIPLDYTVLAGDIFLYQNPDTAGQVRLRWGQDFFACYNNNILEEDDLTLTLQLILSILTIGGDSGLKHTFASALIANFVKDGRVQTDRK